MCWSCTSTRTRTTVWRHSWLALTRKSSAIFTIFSAIQTPCMFLSMIADTSSNHLVATGGASLPLVMSGDDEHCQAPTNHDRANPNVVEKRGPTALHSYCANRGDNPKRENTYASENERPANDRWVCWRF